MPTPDFILELRRTIGHAPLWLPGVSGVVFDDDERVLLVRRADIGIWSVVGGILEPGEDPAVGLVREIAEETAVVAETVGLVEVVVDPMVTYPNGDQVHYLSHVFRCRYVSGEARVNDDESLEVDWFALDELPPLAAHFRRRIAAAHAFTGVTTYRT